MVLDVPARRSPAILGVTMIPRPGGDDFEEAWEEAVAEECEEFVVEIERWLWKRQFRKFR